MKCTMMSTSMPSKYEPQKVEQQTYAYWLEQGIFAAQAGADRQPFCIVIPPPNVTGVLHMGHAFDVSIQDLLTRWHRMLGDAALWLPGTDHAGIATQNVVEAELAREDLSRHDLGREEFVERVWQVKDKHQSHIRRQLQRCGASLDWSRERFTLDEGYSRAVREAFVRLYDEGLIYRGERMINWCPRCATSLSDLEVEHETTEGRLWHIRYPGTDGGPGVVIATTRPETMLGDTAVAVHPDDPRYAHLVGNSVVLPLMDRQIPVIADEHSDMEFGTGALKITPAHDPNDFEIAARHDLPQVCVIAEDGTMTEEAGGYAGMDRFEARRAVVAELELQGLLEGVEDHSHAVGHCSRCHTVVEPLVSSQWFVKMAPLAEEGLRAIRDGRVRFVPERWGKVYCDWLENIRDWCISRQLWWGHPVPVWYCGDCSQMTCVCEDPTECAHCGSEDITRDSDVLDTWFSSALWPFATLGWPDDTDDLRYFYPTSVLVTAYDIIYFWVARMVMMAEHITDQEPFHTVFIHGLVRDEKGRKISKSLGNNIDPIELIEQYGADALRFALVQLITHGQDLTYSEDRILAARNFANKLWNAARFVIMNLENWSGPVDLATVELTLADRWILSRHAATLETVNRELGRYNLAQAADVLYEHVWGEFCDWYVELSKPDLRAETGDGHKAIVQSILHEVLSGIVRALHPFMPFVTEQIWQRLAPGIGSVGVAAYPEANADRRDTEAEAQMAVVQGVVATVRNLRAIVGISPAQRVEVTLQAAAQSLEMLQGQTPAICTLAAISELHLEDESTEAERTALADVSHGVRVLLHTEGAVNLEDELARLSSELAKLHKLSEQCRKKLDNPNFVQRAPEDVVELERCRLAENTADIERLEHHVEILSRMTQE